MSSGSRLPVEKWNNLVLNTQRQPQKSDFVPIPNSPPEIPLFPVRDIPTSIGIVHSVSFESSLPPQGRFKIELQHSPSFMMFFEHHDDAWWHNYTDLDGNFLDSYRAYGTDQDIVEKMPEKLAPMLMHLPKDAKAYVYYTKIEGQDGKTDLLTSAYIQNDGKNLSTYLWMVSK